MPLLLENQPGGALPNLRRVPTLLTHEDHPLKEWGLRESRGDSDSLLGGLKADVTCEVSPRFFEDLLAPLGLVEPFER